MNDALDHDNEIAVVGLACRFPGAADARAFWRNLAAGVESVTFFDDETLLAACVPPEALRSPRFVRAAPVLEGYDRFDAGFFGYSPREAALLDPQQRVLLELAWLALEDAGYDPEHHDGPIGIYAGMSMSSYLLFNLLANPRRAPLEDAFQLMIGTDKDFLSTRISYHLDLRGPSLDVQTGCSTSLVAVHLACEGLLSYQSDMTLAGGVSIQVPSRWGYRYEEGGINSPDGHTRAFDARAGGTVFGSGAGLVVLKRMADALADGDTIRAVIRGSAINNDGAAKLGFTAPGVDGQAEVVARAQAIAGVEPETVSYVEAHGTGTALGDPVEIAALRKVFDGGRPPGEGCAVGSVKTNVGHLDAAAGVAGLIKTILALEHGQLPPSLNYETPNPKIDFGDGAFYVNDALVPWRSDGVPRRAGVSSFGIGGTNAHVVLEETPALPAGGPEGREWKLVPLSARSPQALSQARDALRERLLDDDPAPCADVAFTLQVGRRRFPHRQVVFARTIEELVAALGGDRPDLVWSGVGEAETRPVVFMFPGGGAQHVAMGRGLYREEPVFREEIERCAAALGGRLGADPLSLLYPAAEEEAEAAAVRIRHTAVGLPLLFSVEYALARLWTSWGVEPEAMIGHSLGEYVAACLAGVFSLEDALALVVARGELMERLPAGGMVGVPLPEDEVRDLLSGDLALAAVNGPAQCVVSGPGAEIEALVERLDRTQVEYRRIQIEVAGHSPLMEPALPDLERFAGGLTLQPPRIPYVSNLTGDWIRAEEATDPAYWSWHLRETVRFGDGIALLGKDPDRLFLEVGPGRTLASLAGLQLDRRAGQVAIPSMRHPRDADDDGAALVRAVGKLWAAGAPIDWTAYHRGERRRRLPLPGYPFERERYWIDPLPATDRVRGDERRWPIAEWFYTPAWKGGPLGAEATGARAGESSPWIVLTAGGLGDLLAAHAEERGHRVLRVTPGPGFERRDGREIVLDPTAPEDYRRLIDELAAEGLAAARVVHAWSLDRPDAAADGPDALALGFFSLLFLAQALAGLDPPEDGTVRLDVITDRAFAVVPGDRPVPENVTALAVCLVAPQELDHVRARLVDARGGAPDEAGSDERLAARLYSELAGGGGERVVALRGGYRWVRTYEPLRLEERPEPPWPLRRGGTYLITGGLGGVGLLVARHLAEGAGARLVLTSRTRLPAKERWDEWCEAHPPDDPTSRVIRRVQAVEAAGGTVHLAPADVADRAALEAVLADARARFGRIDGVFHAAGRAGAGTVTLLPDLDRQECASHFRAKLDGTAVLAELLEDDPPDFVLLFSSNVSVLGGLGSTAYTAANLFLDAFACDPARRGGPTRWLSVNWDGWLLEEGGTLSAGLQTAMDRFAMAPSESAETLIRVLTTAPGPQLVVSTGDLEARLALWADPHAGTGPGPQGDPDREGGAARPALGTDFVPPETELEALVARTWQELLGIDEIGVEDNFFDLGGNSLIGLKVIARLKEQLGVDVPVTKLFEGPTVRALSRSLAQDAPAGAEYDRSWDRGARRRARRQRKRMEEVAE